MQGAHNIAVKLPHITGSATLFSPTSFNQLPLTLSQPFRILNRPGCKGSVQLLQPPTITGLLWPQFQGRGNLRTINRRIELVKMLLTVFNKADIFEDLEFISMQRQPGINA